MLLPYRALHEIFRAYSPEQVKERIKKGQGFEWHIGEAPYPSTFIKMQVSIYRRGKHIASFRIDVIDELEIEDEYTIRGARKLRTVEVAENLYRVISEGKPVLVSVLDAWNPLLSINVFGRIDEVDVKSDRINYIIGLPSSTLQYSMKIFQEYLSYYPQMKRNVFVSEINVDLVNAELQAIDAMQRALRQELSKETDDYIKQALESQIQELDNVKEELVPLEPFLSELIGKGIRRRD